MVRRFILSTNRIRRKLSLPWALFLGSLLILVSFQNCSSDDFSNTLVQPSASIVDASNIDEIPFAFEFQPSQISYMSCSRTGDRSQTGGLTASTTHLNDPNVFFTFKLGAYEGSGLSLRPEFIEYVRNKFTFKGTLSDAAIEEALTYGSAHGGAALQLGIRTSTPIANGIFTLGSGQPTQGIAYHLFPSNVLLTFKEFLPQLITLFKTPQQVLHQLGGSTLQSYPLEGVIHLENQNEYNELTAEAVRGLLQSNSVSTSRLLAVTYSEDLRNPQNLLGSYLARQFKTPLSENRVWGKGYKMSFVSDSRMKWKKNVISMMTEYDLTNFEPTSTQWICPAYFRLMIVSPKDLGGPITTMKSGAPYTFTFSETNSATLNAVELNLYSQVKRHLPHGEWMIDWTNSAIAPRKPNLDCYGNRAFNPVDYSGNGSQCGLDSNNFYLHRDCAEFVSICVRRP